MGPMMTCKKSYCIVPILNCFGCLTSLISVIFRCFLSKKAQLTVCYVPVQQQTADKVSNMWNIKQLKCQISFRIAPRSSETVNIGFILSK